LPAEAGEKRDEKKSSGLRKATWVLDEVNVRSAIEKENGQERCRTLLLSRKREKIATLLTRKQKKAMAEASLRLSRTTQEIFNRAKGGRNRRTLLLTTSSGEKNCAARHQYGRLYPTDQFSRSNAYHRTETGRRCN